MYKLGLKFWSVNKLYMNEALRLYQEGYFQYVELYVVPKSYAQYMDLWLDLKKKYNIPFTIHVPHFAHGFNLATKSCEDSNIQMYKEAKDFADGLNAQYIIFHGGIGGDIKETTRQLRSFNEPRLLIENKPYKVLSDSMSTLLCRGYNIEEIKHVIKETHCGFCLDIGHAICAANSMKKEPYEYVHEFMQLKPKMYHLTDLENIRSEFDYHPNLGQGQLEIKKILQSIPAEAIITIETLKNSKDRLDDFINDVTFIKGIGGKS
ncbi:MAG: TIM barrel protein [Candidatus Saganbacteria bacterium]|nr:TIM barrel protein [Candidatus Saganbacteria bacterium]